MTDHKSEFELARARRIEQQHEAAVTGAYREAMAQGEDSIGIILATASVCLGHGDDEKARVLLYSGTLLMEGKDPRAGQLFGLLGVAWARLGNIPEARKALAASIDEDDGAWIQSLPEAQDAARRAWTYQ